MGDDGKDAESRDQEGASGDGEDAGSVEDDKVTC